MVQHEPHISSMHTRMGWLPRHLHPNLHPSFSRPPAETFFVLQALANVYTAKTNYVINWVVRPWNQGSQDQLTSEILFSLRTNFSTYDGGHARGHCICACCRAGDGLPKTCLGTVHVACAEPCLFLTWKPCSSLRYTV